MDKPFDSERQSSGSGGDPGSGILDLLKANDYWLSIALNGVNVWAANRILEFIVVQLMKFTPESQFRKACEESREFLKDPEGFIKNRHPELAKSIRIALAQPDTPEAPATTMRERQDDPK